MSMEFSLDMGRLTKAMRQSPKAVARGAATAMGDIKDDWVREARDIAPIDKGNLRTQIQGNVVGFGSNPYVEVEANATSITGGRRFNYAYYIHEGHMAADGKSLRTPGTVERFLEESLENRKAEYQKWLRDEIKSELRKAGW